MLSLLRRTAPWPVPRFPSFLNSIIAITKAIISTGKDLNGVPVAIRAVTDDAEGLVFRTELDSGLTLTPPVAMQNIATSDFTLDLSVRLSQRALLFEIGGGLNIAWSSLFLEVGSDGMVYFALSYNNTRYDIGGYYGDGVSAGVGPIEWNKRTRLTLVRQGSSLRIYINAVLKGTYSITGGLYNTQTRPLRIGYGQAASGARYSIMDGVLYYLSFHKSARIPS